MDTRSQTQDTWVLACVYFLDPNSIRAIHADVDIVDFEATNCAANPATTQARLDIDGTFFNSGTPAPNSSLRDVVAQLGIFRNATDPPYVLQVQAVMFRCTAADCSTTDSFQLKSLGSISCPDRICPKQTLLLQWEPQNNLFRFRRNATEVTTPYVLADTNLGAVRVGKCKFIT